MLPFLGQQLPSSHKWFHFHPAPQQQPGMEQVPIASQRPTVLEPLALTLQQTAEQHLWAIPREHSQLLFVPVTKL